MLAGSDLVRQHAQLLHLPVPPNVRLTLDDAMPPPPPPDEAAVPTAAAPAPAGAGAPAVQPAPAAAAAGTGDAAAAAAPQQVGGAGEEGGAGGREGPAGWDLGPLLRRVAVLADEAELLQRLMQRWVVRAVRALGPALANAMLLHVYR